MPNLFNPSSMAISLSDSLNLNSPAPVIDVSPSAKLAAIDKIGISSIILGIDFSSIFIPLKAEEETSISATSSPQQIEWFLILMSEPIFLRISSNVNLVSLIPTFLIVIELSLVMSAATIKNDAEEKSPTTE